VEVVALRLSFGALVRGAGSVDRPRAGVRSLLLALTFECERGFARRFGSGEDVHAGLVRRRRGRDS
jgi:hypothetical protein